MIGHEFVPRRDEGGSPRIDIYFIVADIDIGDFCREGQAGQVAADAIDEGFHQGIEPPSKRRTEILGSTEERSDFNLAFAGNLHALASLRYPHSAKAVIGIEFHLDPATVIRAPDAGIDDAPERHEHEQTEREARHPEVDRGEDEQERTDERIRCELLDDVRSLAMPAAGEDVDIRSAALGEDRLLVGAAEAAFARLLDDPVGALAAL